MGLKAPLSERLCDEVCIVFALWTLCCHAVVAAGGTLQLLLMLSAAAGGGLIIAWRLRIGVAAAAFCSALLVERPVRHSHTLQMIQGGGLILGLAGVLTLHWHDNVIVVWWWIVCLLGAAATTFLSVEEPVTLSPVHGRLVELLLWSLAIACVGLTLICHRPDADDAFYVNVAVAAADFPHQALLRTDMLHGINSLPLHLPVYRVHSYELWNGALSYLTGIPAIYCFHWISAAMAALLVPLVHAKLFRLLTPRLWLWATAALVCVLVATGETHRWYGNFAFVRMWQGKSIFLFVFLPLIYTYAVEFGLRPTWRSWLLLCAAQIAAVGCSSSALWAAPVGAMMALGSTLRPTREGLRTLGLGILTSVYVIGIGWFMRGELEGFFARKPIPEPGVKLSTALVTVLGDSNLWLLGIAAILMAWACCPRGLAQRFAISVPLAASVVLLNPYADRWVSAHLTGPSYWRSLWGVPIPILITFLLIAPLQLNDHTWRRMSGRVACLVLIAAFAILVPQFSGVSEENYVRLGYPTLKVPAVEYRWAAALNQSVHPRAYVVAPPDISMWIPTFHAHAYPLQVRHYLNRHRIRLGADDLQVRRMMSQYVAGTAQAKTAAMVFRSGLERFAVSGVCLRRSERATEARIILQVAGFQRTIRGADYEIWVRSIS